MKDFETSPTADNPSSISKQRPHAGEAIPLKLARDCFLSFIADAKGWKAEYDADIDDNGRQLDLSRFTIVVDRRTLEEFAELFGIRRRSFGECIFDRINDAVAKE